MGRVSLAFVLVIAACGDRSSSGPAWPKSAGTEIDPDDDEEDGGESLDPKSADVAAVETSAKADPDTPAAPVDPTATPPADTKPDAPATTDPAAKPAEDAPTFEEIIIEVTPSGP